jgi:hypothetical protein
MLKDRRELLEHDLKIAQEQAAKMYLEIVVTKTVGLDHEYHLLRDRVSSLQFDLDLVNKLIDQGVD